MKNSMEFFPTDEEIQPASQDQNAAQEAAMFDKLFGVDVSRDIEDIKDLMRRRSKYGDGFSSEFSYKSDKEHGHLKYTDEHVKNSQWEDDDFKLACDELRQERIDKYFNNVARKYEQRLPIADSVVRLDQEAVIAQELREHKPVLIRGNWRTGKTSMVLSLETHQFGKENSLHVDTTTQGTGADIPLADFKKLFGTHEICSFLAEKETSGADFWATHEKMNQIQKEIEESQRTPFEFLNEYLSKKDKTLLLSLDEVVGLADQPEKLEYLAGLKDLSQIQLAIVLHRIAPYEDSFKAIFPDYETHFVHALSVKEVGTLVRRPLEGTQITFTEDAILKIIEFTGGRPMEVQNFCVALMSPHSGVKRCRLAYRAQDIEEFIGQKAFESSMALSHAFEVEARNYPHIYDYSMSDEERVIIDRLIKNNQIPVSEIDVGTVQPLIDTTFVIKDADKGVYRLNGELFRRVIAEKNR